MNAHAHTPTTPADDTVLSVALIQTTSGYDQHQTLADVMALVEHAMKTDADFILLPEIVNLLDDDAARIAKNIRSESETPLLDALCNAARKAGKWVLAGSLLVHDVGAEKYANRSFLIDHTGTVVARYDKIHLFDVALNTGETHRESNKILFGERMCVASTPWGGLGMSICYDVRFAALYRALAQHGARLLSIPAAFTHHTGAAHWEILLRARAIENGCFVIAPNQCGVHPSGRKTWGHSAVIDPWGRVLCMAGDEPTIIYARLEMGLVDKARLQVPALSHDRPLVF